MGCEFGFPVKKSGFLEVLDIILGNSCRCFITSRKKVQQNEVELVWSKVSSEGCTS